MISRDSVFRRLPPGLERRQALFFDGIRHCAEIADMAYSRLATTLTTMALHAHQLSEDEASEERTRSIPAAFLDAWATVDAIYRFRGLLKLYPHQREGKIDLPGYKQMLENVSLVRNVSDHLAVKMPHVEAHRAPALGILSWLTTTDGSRFYRCVIYPGTVADARIALSPLPPGGSIIAGPTNLVELQAGKHKVSLSAAIDLFRQRVGKIEVDLAAQLREAKVDHLSAGSDVFVQMTLDAAQQNDLPSQQR